MTSGAAHSELDHDGNLLGALALAVSDRTSAAMADAVGLSESAATALSALHHFLDRPSIDRLRQVLGLTSSGTVRLIDNLVAAGYVRKSASANDGRALEIKLTQSGETAAKRVATARADVLNSLVRTLSDEQRALFDELAGKLLTSMIRPPGATKWNCRQCDTTACGRTEGRCPVANEAISRFAKSHP
jgi:DNA-binding MarR family transcriptional regulator